MRPIQLRESLRTRLSDASRVVVLGVGSEFRGDDALGLLVVRGLAERMQRGGARVPVHLIETETAPENFTGEVRRLGPSHVLVVDAADFHAEAGSVGLIEPERAGGLNFCTHALGVGLVSLFLRGEAGCDVVILGVQPLSLGFGSPVSEAVAGSVAFLVEAIAEAVGG
jgi:hydrogenase maturation protease HycI